LVLPQSFKLKNPTDTLQKPAPANFTPSATARLIEDNIMATMIKNTASMSAAAFRVSMLVLMMTGPVLAVTMMKANNAPKFSGAGLVLIVSIERNA
jgi:hypothetical protein